MLICGAQSNPEPISGCLGCVSTRDPSFRERGQFGRPAVNVLGKDSLEVRVQLLYAMLNSLPRRLSVLADALRPVFQNVMNRVYSSSVPALNCPGYV
jgi:hypothetical protein